MHSYFKANAIYNYIVRLIENNDKAYIDGVTTNNIPEDNRNGRGNPSISDDKILRLNISEAI